MIRLTLSLIKLRIHTLQVLMRLMLHDEKFEAYFGVYVKCSRVLRRTYGEIVYRLALITHLPWPRAYMWRASRVSGQLGRTIASDGYNKLLADRYFNKAKIDLELLCAIPEYCVEAAALHASNALLSGRSDEWIIGVLREYGYQEHRAAAAGGDDLGFRVLEPSFSVLRTIGHAMHIDGLIKGGIIGMRPPFRVVLLLQPWLKRFVVNPCLLDYWRPYIDVVEDPQKLAYLQPLAKALAFNLHGVTPHGSRLIPFSISSVVETQLQWEKEGRGPLLQLTFDHRERGIRAMERWGVPRGSWFVTMHVRSGTNKGAELYRDSTLDNYREAVSIITSAGGWLIRMGDASMVPMPIMKNVVDYAHEPAKADWLDVFLCAAARFMIGTSSGLTTVSYTFGVPIAMTNCLPTASIYLRKQDIFLPRLMRSRANGQILSLSKIMGLPYSMGINDGMYRNILGVETIENSAGEISDLVSEMLNVLDGNPQYSAEDERLQQTFKTITVERETLVGSGGVALPARIGQGFLRNHRTLLN